MINRRILGCPRGSTFDALDDASRVSWCHGGAVPVIVFGLQSPHEPSKYSYKQPLTLVI